MFADLVDDGVDYFEDRITSEEYATRSRITLWRIALWISNMRPCVSDGVTPWGTLGVLEYPVVVPLWRTGVLETQCATHPDASKNRSHFLHIYFIAFFDGVCGADLSIPLFGGLNLKI